MLSLGPLSLGAGAPDVGLPGRCGQCANFSSCWFSMGCSRTAVLRPCCCVTGHSGPPRPASPWPDVWLGSGRWTSGGAGPSHKSNRAKVKTLLVHPFCGRTEGSVVRFPWAACCVYLQKTPSIIISSSLCRLKSALTFPCLVADRSQVLLLLSNHSKGAEGGGFTAHSDPGQMVICPSRHTSTPLLFV